MKKMVIQVQMNCEKCRIKAKKIVAGENGVSSLALEESKDEIVVTGEGFDPVKLARKLRRKVGYAIIKSLQEEKGKEETESKDEKKQEDKTQILNPQDIQWSCSHIGYLEARPMHQVLFSDPNPNVCSIL